MKKINNYFLIAALVATSFTFGCKKDAKTVEPANGTATISGIVKYDFNIANDTTTNNFTIVRNYETTLPTGLIPIIATINTADLVLNPTGTYPNKEFRTYANADGSYSFTIDANAKTVNVKITTGDFRHDQIGPLASRSPKTTSNYIYAGETITNNVQVVNGDVKILPDFNSAD
jgi:hypothetical protein